MNTMKKTVLAALKEKNPALLQQLTDANQLSSFLEQRSDEISDEIATSTQEIARKNGRNEAKTLEEKAGIIRMSQSLATERALSTMLEFPLDETYPSRPDETSLSAMAT